MVVFVFTDSATVKNRLGQIDRAKKYELSVLPGQDARKVLKESPCPTMAYVDFSHLENGDGLKLARYLGSLESVRFAVLDPQGSVEDIGALFHAGAVDYLGKSQLRDEIPTKRVDAALGYYPFEAEVVDGTEGARSKAAWRPSGSDWEGIRSGEEYTFCFLFVELDLIDEWKRKSGRDHLDSVIEKFQSHIESVVGSLNGRVWMWTEYGGLVLFPFDGKSCDAILSCFRLVLNRDIISAEIYSYNTLISYRMALHIGNTTYRAKGKTGTIVSESLNFLFHLFKHFAEPANFYLTEPVLQFLPSGLADCFVDAGSFEGTSMFRMRLPK